MNKFITVLVLLATSYISLYSQKSALFLGNSMTASNDMPGMVSRLAAAAGDSLYIQVVWGGQTFQQQLQNQGFFNLLNSRSWDYFSLQENSTLSGLYPGWNQNGFEFNTYEYAQTLNDTIINKQKCTDVSFFMLWGYIVGDTINYPDDTYIAHQARMRRNSLVLARDFDAVTSPVGVAWQRVRQEKPWLELYSQDGYHPSPKGSYLAACVIYTTFYKKSPYNLQYFGNIPDTTALYLQQVAAETVLDSLETWNFGVAKPFRTPEKLYPTNNAEQVQNKVTFSWNKEKNSQQYVISYATKPDFTNTINAVISDTFHTVDLDYGTTYFWKVASRYSSTSYTSVICTEFDSQPFSFTTVFVGPKLTMPTDSTKCVTLDNAYFIWEKLDNFNRYVLQIAKDPNFQNVVLTQMNINGLSFKTTLPEQLIPYYWRVQPYENVITKKWSKPFMFWGSIGTPTHESPANKSTNVSKLIFRWMEMQEAEKYVFQLSKDSLMNTVDVEFDNLTEPQCSTELVEFQTKMFWRVAAYKNGCRGPYSHVWSLLTSMRVPTQIYPENNSEGLPLNIFFQWNKEKAKSYEILISEDENFENIFFGKVGVPVNNITVNDFKQMTKYYWKIRYINLGETSPWSEVYSFTTGIKGLNPPSHKKPQFDEVKVPLTVVFEWFPAQDALGYDLQVSKSSDFDEIIAENSEPITETTWTCQLEDNYTNYYYRIRSRNLVIESPWSAPWQFRTIAKPPTAKPVLVSPDNNFLDTRTDVQFKWNPVEYADRYRFVLTTKEADTMKTVVDYLSLLSNECGVSGLEYETQYHWQVWGWNEAGESPGSDLYSFLTENKPLSVEQEKQELFSIYPNPTDGKINITSLNNIESISICDVTGRVHFGYINSNAHIYNMEISLKDVLRGIYFITLKTDNETITKKLVVIGE